MEETKIAGRVAELAAKVEQAAADLKACEEAESNARRHATSARNALNNLQKEFDAAVQTLKKNAGGDWTAYRGSSAP